jgi:hypothetical protein
MRGYDTDLACPMHAPERRFCVHHSHHAEGSFGYRTADTREPLLPSQLRYAISRPPRRRRPTLAKCCNRQTALPARKPVDDDAQFAQTCREAASGVVERAAPNPRILTGWFGASSHALRVPRGLSSGFPFARRVLPPSSAVLWFPSSGILRLSPFGRYPSSGSPSASLRIPYFP